MKLAIRPFTLVCGILWGAMGLFCGLANMWFPPYAEPMLQLLGSVYPGYTPDGSFGSAICVAIYATFDGAIGGFIFAWLYNLCVQKLGSE